MPADVLLQAEDSHPNKAMHKLSITAHFKRGRRTGHVYDGGEIDA